MKKKAFNNLLNYVAKKRLFSLMLVSFIIFGLVSWLSLKAAVERSINYRLESQLNRINSSITDNLNNYSITLSYIHSYIKTEGLPDFEKFRKIIKSIELERIKHGIQGVGYITLLNEKNLSRYLAQNKKLPAFRDDWLKTGKKLYAPITMVEPMNWRRSQMLGYDMLADVPRGEAVEQAINSGLITISKDRMSAVQNDPDPQHSALLLLPYYGSETPDTIEKRKSSIKGLIYIPIRMRDFFENAMGKPNVNTEPVNFKLESIDKNTQELSTAYSRFKLAPESGAREKSRFIDLYGRTWKLTVTTLPAFLTFGDKYLTKSLAFVFLLFIVLLLGLFYQSQTLLEHEMQAKKIMLEADRIKTAFLSNMSHEVRTPLNAITGFAEILARADQKTDKKYLIESMRKNSNELTALIDNLLDISKIEFGTLLFDSKSICLVNLIEQIKLNMQPRAFAKTLDFRIESSGDLPTGIQIDESRVKQILLNLIGNAIKFTEKGAVTLKVKAEKTDTGAHYLLFDIHDTGIGLSKKEQADLFSFFSQADGSSTRKYGGAGIGLALSKRLAQQFKGDVTLIESERGKGSTFQLKIPFGITENTEWKKNLLDGLQTLASHYEPAVKVDLRGKKILIVEDSPDNQEIFEYFLKTAGALTEVVADGEAAVKRSNETNFDLILMDIQIPKMDGLTATRKIRSQGYTRPIIALTAHASLEEKKNCLEAGCLDLITKPVSQETLIHRILLILEENSYVI